MTTPKRSAPSPGPPAEELFVVKCFCIFWMKMMKHEFFTADSLILCSKRRLTNLAQQQSHAIQHWRESLSVDEIQGFDALLHVRHALLRALRAGRFRTRDDEKHAVPLSSKKLARQSTPRELFLFSTENLTRLSSRQSAAGSVHRQDSTCPNPPMPESAMCLRYR